MATTGEPTRRTRITAIIVVFALLAVGLFFGIRAIIEAAGSHPLATPSASSTPTPTSTSAGFLYTSSEFGYSIEFPAEPSEQTNTVPVDDAEVSVTSAVWEGGTRSLVSTAGTYPAGALSDVSASLKSALDGLVSNTPGAQLVSSDPVTLAEIPAVEASIAAPSGNLVVIIAIDGDTQYQLVAAGFERETADGFFATFAPR